MVGHLTVIATRDAGTRKEYFVPAWKVPVEKDVPDAFKKVGSLVLIEIDQLIDLLID